eukprot:958591-Pyramimonas_sp.AAC.1
MIIAGFVRSKHFEVCCSCRCCFHLNRRSVVSPTSENWGGGGGGGGGDGGGCHTQGFSGRILRKLPFLAHTHLMQPRCSCEEYINALQQACNVERTDRDVLAG